MRHIAKIAAFWLLLAGVASAQTSRIPIGPALNGQSDAGNGTVTSVTGGNGIVIGGTSSAPTVSLPACTAAQILIENGSATAFICSTTGALSTLGVGQNLISAGGNLNTSGVPSGFFNCKDLAYGAVGNCATDDTAHINSCIAAACASGANGIQSSAYLPATPNSCYATTSPLLVNCSSIKFFGAGWKQTKITQNYYGPTLLVEGVEAGWKPPLTTSVTATWLASHAYGQYKEIIDSNGNVEVATTAGTSGTPTHPVWPLTVGGTVVDGGTLTWTLEMIGTSLATGGGGSLDGVSPEFFPGAGYGNNNATIEVANPANLENSLQGLSSWSIEFYVNVVAPTNSGNQFGLLGYRIGAPGSGNTDAFKISLLDGTGSCAANCLQATMDIGGSNINVNPTIAGANMTPRVIHEIEFNHDNGSNTANLFLDGVLIKSAAATGTWTIPKYETLLLADQGAQCYLCGQFNFNAQVNILPAYYDSLRISNVARHTSGFTPPTTKFAQDGNTVFLLNYPTGTPTGTLEATVGTSPVNAFIPVETSNGATTTDPIEISDMQLSDNGIWATWTIDSTIKNIWVQGNPRTCLNLANNDFQNKVDNFSCRTSPNTSITNAAFVFGNQSNNNDYSHLQAQGQQSGVIIEGGSGNVRAFDFGDFGNAAIYPLVFYQTFGVTVDTGVTDIEDTPTLLGVAYLKGNVGPVVFLGGFYTVDGTITSLVTQAGGMSASFEGVNWNTKTFPAELLNVISAPSTQTVFRDTNYSTFAYWKAATSYTSGQIIIDSNGNYQQETTGGTSAAATQPTWATTVGSTTADGTGALVWTLVTLRTNASSGQYLSILNGNKAEETFVAGLPSCATLNRDVPWNIDNCTTCTYGSACTGGGATFCHEICTPAGTWLAQ